MADKVVSHERPLGEMAVEAAQVRTARDKIELGIEHLNLDAAEETAGIARNVRRIAASVQSLNYCFSK